MQNSGLLKHQIHVNRVLGSVRRQGFSLPEVMIAALILMIVLAAVVESQMNSFQTINVTKQRNAVQARIAKDLNALRSQSDRWKCIEGTSCSGLAADQDNPMRFDLSECQQDNPLETYPIEDASLEVGINGLWIEREMTLASTNRHIDVNYTSEVGGKIINVSSTISPEFLKWCGF